MHRQAAKGADLVHLLVDAHQEVRDVFWSYLKDERWNLRLVCRALKRSISSHVGRLFRELYIRVPVLDKDSTTGRVVGPLCHHLTITIEVHAAKLESSNTTSRSSSSSSSGPLHQQYSRNDVLVRLLDYFRHLRKLTLRINGNGDWSPQTEIAESIVALRVAMEQNKLETLRTLILSPTRAMGIVYLNWSGFAAFGPSPVSSRVWKQLDTLDLRIHSPFAPRNVCDGDAVTFKKMFYNYLLGFSKTLRILRVIWLDNEGPSPLMLHQEGALKGRRPIPWAKLEEVWVGNIWLPFQTTKSAKELVPSLRSMKLLRSTQKESGLVSASDSSAWIDIGISGGTLIRRQRRSSASSVYSQDSEYGNDAGDADSASSMSIKVWKGF